MIQRIDHVSLAVTDYEKARNFFINILGAVPGASARDDSMKYMWQIFSIGDLTRFELLTPTGKGSFLDNFLSSKDGGVHHITFQTSDIRKSKLFLEQNGIPYFGYIEYGDAWKELFIHPRDAFGVLIQIAEFRPDDWLPKTVRLAGKKRWNICGKENETTLSFAHPGGGTVSFHLSREEAQELAAELDAASQG